MMLKTCGDNWVSISGEFPIEQVPVVRCEPEVIGNSLPTASRGAPRSSFHTWTSQYLQQFSGFRDVQRTLAGTAKQNVNQENRAGA